MFSSRPFGKDAIVVLFDLAVDALFLHFSPQIIMWNHHFAVRCLRSMTTPWYQYNWSFIHFVDKTFMNFSANHDILNNLEMVIDKTMIIKNPITMEIKYLIV